MVDRKRTKKILAMALSILMISSVIDYSAFIQVSAKTLSETGIQNEEDTQNHSGSVSESNSSESENSTPEEPQTEEDSTEEDSTEESPSENSSEKPKESPSENALEEGEESLSDNSFEEALTGETTDWSNVQNLIEKAGENTTIDLSDFSTPADDKVYTFTVKDKKQFTLKGNGTKIQNVAFVFESNSNNITIENLNIESADNHADSADSEGYSPLHFTGTGNTLTIKGQNTISSGQVSSDIKYGAAVGVPAGAELTIKSATGDTDASLLAESNGTGAGIGGGNEVAAGTIFIESGTISANGAITGIGGGSTADGGIVTIKGGKVTAKGNSGAGIGGAFNTASNGGQGGTVTITGGNVTAEGGGGAGIGGGGCMKNTAGSGGTVTITGGTVRATGGMKCAGIGGGGSLMGTPGSGGAVIITGGSVYAQGGKPMNNPEYWMQYAPKIGGGLNESYQNIDHSFWEGAPATITNGNGSTIHLNTLKFEGSAQTDALITSGSIGGRECSMTPNAEGGVYGIKDVHIDNDKKIYVWLPASSEEETVTMGLDDGNYYEGKFSRPAEEKLNTLKENCLIRWTALKSSILAGTVTNVDLTLFSTPEEPVVISLPKGNSLNIKGVNNKNIIKKINNVSFLFQGNNNVTIEDVDFMSADHHTDSQSVKGYAPFYFAGGSNSLTFIKTNKLTSGQTSSQTGYGAAIQVVEGASLNILPGGEGASITAAGSFGAGISGGNITFNGGNITATDQNGTYGIKGNVVIQGGSIQAVIDGAPKDESNHSVFLNKLTIPKQNNQSVSAGSIGAISCSTSIPLAAGSYGIGGVKTDNNGTVWFWLPDTASIEEVNLTVNGLKYAAIYQRKGEIEKTLSDPSFAKWEELQEIINQEGEGSINLSTLESPESPFILSVPENKKLTIISDGKERNNLAFLFNGNNQVTIQNLNIKSANNHSNEVGINAYGPLQFSGNKSTLIIRGKNIIRSGQSQMTQNYGAGVNVRSTSELTICVSDDDPSASIEAYGGTGGAGIGGGKGQTDNTNYTCGKITIESGHISAFGGDNGAGIGSGNWDKITGSITINGGTIVSEGGKGGAGIGRGNFLNLEDNFYTRFTVNGGVIFSKAGDGAEYGFTMYPAINGGSVSTNNTWKYEPKNSAGEKVYKNTLTVPDVSNGAITAGSVSGIDCMSTVPTNGAYGIKDVKTDENGKLYFYLPASSEPDTIKLTVDGVKYTSTYLRENDKTYEQTLGIDEIIRVTMPSIITYGEDWEPKCSSKAPDAKFRYSYKGTLESGASYGPSDQRPEDAGKYTVTAVLDSTLYVGSAAADFTIVKRELTQNMISVSGNSFTYNGSPQEPVIVKSEKKVFQKNRDYTVQYSNNTNAGTATAIITGQGNCTGTKQVTFTISKAVPESLIWPTALDITYGARLSDATLSGGSTTGTWKWAEPNMIPTAGEQSYEVIFTPKDTANYDWSNIITRQKVSVTVYKANGLETLSIPTLNAKDGSSRNYTFNMNNIALNKADTGAKTYLVVETENADNILTGVQVSGNNLTYSIADTAMVGNTATIAVTIQTENYMDYTTTLTITVSQRNTQAIAFDTELDAKTYGDGNFTHTALLQGDGGNGTVTYESSDKKVATVDKNTGEVTIVGAGSTNMIATKANDEEWFEATAIYSLNVNRKNITITADDKTIIIGEPQPAYTYTKTGLVKDDNLTKEPTITCPTANTEVIGTYPIVPDNADAGNNYTITYANGTLTVVNGYPVTVTYGTGGKKYIEGHTVTITANDRKGYTFTGWSSTDGVTFADCKATTTTFIMPGKAVTVTANYSTDDHYLIDKDTAAPFEGGADKKGYATVTLKKTEYVYTGAEIRPVPVVYFTYTEYDDTGKQSGKPKKKKLVENVDYTLFYKAGTVLSLEKILITGIGDYKGTMTQDFTITPKSIKKAVIEPIQDVKATGADLKTQMDARILVKDGVNTVSRNDYDIIYQVNGVEQTTLLGDATNPILVTVSVTGKNNYKDAIKKTQTFTILPQKSNATSVSDDFILTVKLPKKGYTYSGKAMKPKITVTSRSNKKIKANKDYQVIYENNINAGTATITVSGKNKYYGSKSINFTIQPKEMSKVKVKNLSNIAYRVTIEDLELSITDGGRYLENHVDYEVDFSRAKDLRLEKLKKKKVTLSVNAVPGSNYIGTKTVTCYIIPRSLTNKITTKIECSDVVYTDSMKKDGATPVPVIHYNGDQLEMGTDFKVTYANNKKAGTGKVVIQGIGNYSGKRTVKFKITK
ncbi:MAG: MBG domain-containing protein [Lachnospiraceae bacterium]|nr:MBG domain-containing protein [Lachnospiraceae bacterium]